MTPKVACAVQLLGDELDAIKAMLECASRLLHRFREFREFREFRDLRDIRDIRDDAIN
jgi:hypothetical protein